MLPDRREHIGEWFHRTGTGSRNEPEFERSLESAAAVPSSPLHALIAEGRDRHPPHGMHAARSPDRCRANSSPSGGVARASQFLPAHRATSPCPTSAPPLTTSAAHSLPAGCLNWLVAELTLDKV